MNARQRAIRLRHPLPFLSVLLVVLSLLFFPLSRGSIIADIPEVVVPLGVSLAIALYSVWLLQTEYDVDRIKQIAVYGWVGAIVASVGIWVLSQQLQPDLSITLLLDEALTTVSVGTGTAVVLGARTIHGYRSEDRSDRDHVVAETVWTTEPRPNPILTAVTTQIAELEGVDPLELDPLYDHIDPDVFAGLRTKDGSQWQLRFYTDDYEIRVSGQGTVTLYDIPDGEADTVLVSEER